MTSEDSQRALRPVEPEPGVRVHTTADRNLAIEHWLLATRPDRKLARQEWATHGVAMLPLGGLFSAVRIPNDLIQALAASDNQTDLDTFLEDALNGGPVICDPRHHRYYALVPATVPVTWKQAVDDWRAVGVDCLGRGAYLGVPRPNRTDFRGCTGGSYWSVPMRGMAMLCAPLTVARLIAAGTHQMAELAAAADSGPGPAGTGMSLGERS